MMINHDNVIILNFMGFTGGIAEYQKRGPYDTWYSAIIDQYNADEIKIYQFNWCIVYSTDGGKTYIGILKHEYEDKIKVDLKSKEIFDLISNN